MTQADDLSQAAQVVLGKFGHVDAVIHVAGGFEMGEPVHGLRRESWTRMMDLNAWSFSALVQAFAPSMINRGSGRIVAVSAKAASRGMASMGAYAASKSALQRLVEAAAAELGPHAICVNSVAPSVLDTPANRQAMPDADWTKWVAPASAARTIAFLASDATANLHGHHLVLDA